MIVVDASVLANAIGDDEADGQLARDAIGQGGGASAPDLVDVETVAVLRKRWLAGTLPARRFASAVRDLEDLALDRYPSLRLMWRAYELRDNVTPYDAAYVALAEALDCPLVTADARLAKAPGIRCEVELVTAPG
ncbi:MAG: type II toxin-antitoxin system VapC family toxin [Actinobacteria bacterium]|nr:type II toxin-antitoxin system VapC family toxin [Actinomycetota bacterium]